MDKHQIGFPERKTPEASETDLEVSMQQTQEDEATESVNLQAECGDGKGELQLSSPSVRDAAKNYIQKGWRPVPVPFKEKGPRLPDWQNKDITINNLHEYFKDELQNIGVILGDPSGGLVDIDLDAPEALKLADAFLPQTDLVFGRKGKPRSHWLYITNPTPEKTVQFETSEGIMLVELRSTGGQTVFPPSVHESGEHIRFEREAEPAVVSGDELTEKVTQLAAAALLVRHWPKKGSRQHAAMALAGGLARAGWEKSDIRHFILEVAKAAGDKEATQRMNCVDGTEKKTEAGSPVTGWPRLSQLIGGQIVERVRTWLVGQGTAKDQIERIRKGKGKEPEKHRKISAIVLDELRDSGVFYKTSHELYYFDQLNYRLFPLTDVELRSRINDRFDINGSEPTWKFLLEDLQKEALLYGQETTIYQFARYERNTLYLYKGHEQVYKITGEGVTIVPNGTDGMLFLNPDMEPVVESSDEASSHGLEFVTQLPHFNGKGNLTSKQEAHLYRLWFYSLFFESLLPTKPILLLLGEKGSGKSMGLRALLRVLLGKKAQVLSLSKEDAFIAAVTSHHLAAFDNLDGEIKWLPNHLATAATGGDVPLRKLYTTNELARYPLRCFLAFTSREPDSLTRDDVADRLLALRVDRIDPYTPESQILASIDEARPKIWEELLSTLQRIVRALESAIAHPSSHRLADFASLALNIGPVLGIEENDVRVLLEGMDSEKAEFALEHNPLYHLLEEWLEKKGMNDRQWITTKDLFDEMQELVPSKEKFPKKNAAALGRELGKMKPELKGLIDVIGPEKLPGGNNRNFWCIHPVEKLTLAPHDQASKGSDSVNGGP